MKHEIIFLLGWMSGRSIPAPGPPWYQFSLRSLLILVTLSTILLFGWPMPLFAASDASDKRPIEVQTLERQERDAGDLPITIVVTLGKIIAAIAAIVAFVVLVGVLADFFEHDPEAPHREQTVNFIR